jgi:c-di-GMP-binding flagellar brake protein YcgR
MEDLSQYIVKHPKKILAHFKTMIANKCLISASFGDKHSFITAIIDIDEKKQLITIDCGPKEYLNRELLSLNIVDFKSEVDGVEVLFRGHGIKKVGKMSQPALTMKMPETIYWIQRRKSYRVRSPLSKNSYCSISFYTSDGDKETLNFQLFDLSASGFSIMCDTAEEAEQLLPSSEFHNSLLILDGMETYDISFSVQRKFPVNPENPLKSQRIGCRFIDLSPADESSFLRYTQAIEREIKHTLG